MFRYRDRWHVYSTTADSAGRWSLGHTSFAQWSEAASTTKDPSDPFSWSAPRNFFGSEPTVVTENKGDGAWLDFWTSCDRTDCHLFFSDGNGHQYRTSATAR
ncbi:hypothetical protein [Streptomyces afghaniensis]|uniref:hypothetical protein n=1 Tax=Streptomyces afghaniensis TaxID=66865 RepID=UPI0037A97D3A